MTPIKQMIEVMQGYADGKTIEARSRRGDSFTYEWVVLTGIPTWDWSLCDYRIAPSPPKTEERWFNLYPNCGDGERFLGTTIYYTKEDADVGAARDRIGRIKVILTEGQWDE